MLYPLTGHAKTGSSGGLQINLRPEPDYSHWQSVQHGGPLDAPESIPYGATRTWESLSFDGRFYSSDTIRRPE